jgi:hypothetical protein
VNGGLPTFVYGFTLVHGFTSAGQLGWAAPLTVAAPAAGAVLPAGFYGVERRAAAPLVPVRVLRRRSVVWGNTAGGPRSARGPRAQRAGPSVKRAWTVREASVDGPPSGRRVNGGGGAAG